MSNLLDSLKGLVSNELVSAAASSMGESESGISKAIGGILPSLLGGILQSNSSNHSMIGDLLTQAGGNNNLLGDLIGGITSGNSSPSTGIGSSLLTGLFGNKVSGIANLVSNFAGIKSSSSNSLLGIGGSLIASFLGKKMLGEGLNFGGIMNWLGGQKSVIESAIPAGFGSFLGMGSQTASEVASNAKAASAQVASNLSEDDNSGGGMKWLLPLILLGLLGFGLWYWLKGCNKEGGENMDAAKVENSISTAADSASTMLNAAADSTKNAVTATVDAAKGTLDEAGNWIAEKGEAIKIKLENGVELDATKGSLEDKFVSFIKDQNAAPGKDIWFNFEDLLFETGKSTLKASSQKQLENTVAILKAYPKVKIKLGGYTDNVGDSTANMKLSEARAKTVYNQIISKGVTTASFDEKPYEGYGPQHPVADNSTPEGRGQNRRISISVRAK